MPLSAPLLLLLLACHAEASPPAVLPPAEAPPPPAPESKIQTVQDAFPPPAGATLAEADRFGASLRALRVQPAGVPVLTHDGRVVHHHARVIELPLVRGDLQQCADSALRLRAEFLRDQGLPVSFHTTSGDPLPWSRYRAGERARAEGRGITWHSAAPASWDTYLHDLFMWAGTISLQNLDTLPDTHPDPGDVLVQGGSPGHAVVILDVATRGEQTWLLVGEGFMPAQNFHVELGPEGGWWRWDPARGLELPAWDFPATALRRWKPVD